MSNLTRLRVRLYALAVKHYEDFPPGEIDSLIKQKYSELIEAVRESGARWEPK